MGEVTDLDALVINDGEEFNDKEQKTMNINDNKPAYTGLAYDDFGPLPGKKIELTPDIDDEADTEKKVLEMSAMLKLQKENEAYQRMSDNEKIKDYVIKSQYYKQTNDWYHKYGYDMSGKQKRMLRRDLEKAWNKGKFKITPEQREDILFELNKASRAVMEQQPQQQTGETTAGHIADLNSLIFK